MQHSSDEVRTRGNHVLYLRPISKALSAAILNGYNVGSVKIRSPAIS